MLSVALIGEKFLSPLGVMLLVGVCGMLACACWRRKQFGLTVVECVILTALLTVCGVVGTILLYRLESGSFGGLSLYGSVFLVPLVMPLFGFLFRLKPSQTMDLCGPCAPIMIGCLRINCFISGCCGGWMACVGDFCFTWPTQMIDSIADFAIVLWLLRTEEKQPHSGKLFPMFMVAYSVMRFLLEFLRDSRKDWLYMSPGQWFALAAIVIGISWLMVLKKHSAKKYM